MQDQQSTRMVSVSGDDALFVATFAVSLLGPSLAVFMTSLKQVCSLAFWPSTLSPLFFRYFRLLADCLPSLFPSSFSPVHPFGWHHLSFLLFAISLPALLKWFATIWTWSWHWTFWSSLYLRFLYDLIITRKTVSTVLLLVSCGKNYRNRALPFYQ